MAKPTNDFVTVLRSLKIDVKEKIHLYLLHIAVKQSGRWFAMVKSRTIAEALEIDSNKEVLSNLESLGVTEGTINFKNRKAQGYYLPSLNPTGMEEHQEEQERQERQEQQESRNSRNRGTEEERPSFDLASDLATELANDLASDPELSDEGENTLTDKDGRVHKVGHVEHEFGIEPVDVKNLSTEEFNKMFKFVRG